MRSFGLLLLLTATTVSAQMNNTNFTRAATAAHVGLAAYDIAQTCSHLGPHWHEDFLPSQHCAPIAGMIGGQVVAEEFLAHKLSRTHPRLAQVLRVVSISDTLVALTYSWTHR